MRKSLADCLSVALVSASALGPAPSAYAADPTGDGSDITALSLEELLDLKIYSSSRFVQTTSEAPSAARVITAAEIRAQGWRTLADALASLPGVFTSYDRTYTFLGARGFLRPGDYDSRFLLLIDGVRVNDPVYDQAPIGSDFLVDMRLVDRIEYVPGPGSATFGSNAFFGVINVITRKGQDLAGAEVTVEGGSFGYRNVAARYGWSGGSDRGLLLEASRQHTDGDDLYFPEFDTPGSANGIARGLDDLAVNRAFLKANVGAVSLMVAHASQTKGDPTASFDQLFGDPRSQARDERTIADLSYQGDIANDVSWSTRVYAGQYTYLGTFVYTAASGPLNYDTATARWFGGDLQAMYTGWGGHKVVAGLDVQRDIRRDLSNYDRDPDITYLDFHSTNLHLAPFVEDEIALRDDLRLNVGLRYDHTTVSEPNTSPRVALIYSPSATTTLKALVGQAYRAPNAYEMSYAVPGDGGQLPSPNLDSERIRTTELVWSQRLGIHTTLTSSVFHYDIRNLISQAMDADSGLVKFTNSGRVTSRGFEVAFDGVWDNGTTARASYSYADVTDAATGLPFRNAPRSQLKLGVTTPLGESGLVLGAEARHVGSREGLAERVDAYDLVNVTLAWPVLRDSVELSMTLRNLFDARYADLPGPSFAQSAIEQDGRTVLFAASYRF
ncbi:MAG: TonB-dependent receptor [Rhodanobacteraceae bacterium]